VRISGSGSALAAVYRSRTDLDNAALEVGENSQRLIATATRSAAAPAPEPETK
jgi:hypothetical protein